MLAFTCVRVGTHSLASHPRPLLPVDDWNSFKARPAGALNDLYAYNPAAKAWTNLSASAIGAPPSPRFYQGFSASAGLLYVLGGFGEDGRSEFPARGSALAMHARLSHVRFATRCLSMRSMATGSVSGFGS